MTEILGNICSPCCFIWTIIYNPINLKLTPIRENSKHVHWLGLSTNNLESMLSFLCKILMSFSKPWRYCWYITLSILDPPPRLDNWLSNVDFYETEPRQKFFAAVRTHDPCWNLGFHILMISMWEQHRLLLPMTRTNVHSKQLWHCYSMGIVKGRSKNLKY